MLPLAEPPGFRANGDLTASAAASDVAGPVSPNSDASASSFPALTSTGRLASKPPSGVSVSADVNAPCSRNAHIADSSASLGGGSSHGNARGSHVPPAMFLSCSTRP